MCLYKLYTSFLEFHVCFLTMWVPEGETQVLMLMRQVVYQGPSQPLWATFYYIPQIVF